MMRNRYRPVQHFARTPLEMLLEILTALWVIIVVAMTCWGYLTLPAIIPTHYGISGTPNAYGGKEHLLFAPILSICLSVLLILATSYPHLYNYPWQITEENAQRQYALARLLLHWLAFEVAWMFCGLQWIVIQSAQGPLTSFIVLIIPASALLLIITIIIYIVIAARRR